MLYRYNDFVKEGLLSKGLELLNYSEIKENDKLAKKYIDMIYTDYKKMKNLFAVKIYLDNDGTHQRITYKICDDPRATVNTSGGDYDYTSISLTSTHDFDIYDKSKATISVGFSPVGDGTSGSARTRTLFGRQNGKLVIDEINGVDENTSRSINISQGQVDKLIKFFRNEFLKKYPELKDKRHLSYSEILSVDKELGITIDKERQEDRKRREENYKAEDEKRAKLIEQTAMYDEEYLKDYFFDLTSMISDKYNTHLKINTGFIEDNEITVKNTLTFSNNMGNTKSNFVSHQKYKNKKNYPNGSIYILDYTLYLPNDYDEKEESDKFKQLHTDIKLYLKDNYGLSLGTKNSIFNLINISFGDPFGKYIISPDFAKEYTIVLSEVS